MKLTIRRIFGAASALAALMGTGVLAVTAPASARSAQPWPHAVVTAQTATVFDLNGTFKDNGSARPRITVVNDVLTVDLSSQNRPPAYGLVFDDHTILVIFPDINAWFRGTLVAPGTILWSNNTIWQKLPYVPDVTGDSLNEAVAALKAAGFTAKTLQGPSCGSGPLFVLHQAPLAGTQADSGSQVRVTMSNC
jgi:PASTA domain